MEKYSFDEFRVQLNERREKLLKAKSSFEKQADFETLLNDVDHALEKINKGNYGECDGCNGDMEVDRLLANPLVSFCLDCLNDQQQRELEEDLDLASSIQNTLLPENDVECNGWRVSYHYKPAGPVSGDYCDLITANDNCKDTLFFLGDVSGKGVAASMLMTHLHAMFHSLTVQSLPLEELIGRANHIFCDSTLATHYTTLVSGRLFESGKVRLCNAGHCPPVLIRENKTTSYKATGMPIGMFCSVDYKVDEFQMESGESLLLHTDGLNEVQNIKGEYGLERVAEIASNHPNLPPNQLINVYLDDLKNFNVDPETVDDLTIMVIHRI